MGKTSTVRVEIDQALLNKAIASLESTYDKILKDKCFELAERLAKEVGQPTAQGWFGETVEVTAKPMRGKNGYNIIASGKSVCFLEFGAGLATDSSHPFAKNVSFSVTPGSWSKEHAKQFSTQGYWIFGGRRYEEVFARRGLYNAYKQIIAEAPAMAREVFG